MEKDRALQIIREILPEKRYIHTLGVLETAQKLASRYGANLQKVEIAAIFHDYAKYRNPKEMKEIVVKEKWDEALLYYGDELLHGPVGAFYLKNELGINDEEILNAVRFHTTGRANMTLIEKIIYIADFIEPNRSFAGIEEVRELAYENLDDALVTSIVHSIQFLTRKKKPVFPTTLVAYNFLVLKEDK